MATSPDDLLTLDEVAADLRTSYEHARKLVKSGRLPYVDIGTGEERACIRVRRGTFDSFKRQELRDKSETIVNSVLSSRRASKVKQYV